MGVSAFLLEFQFVYTHKHTRFRMVPIWALNELYFNKTTKELVKELEASGSKAWTSTIERVLHHHDLKVLHERSSYSRTWVKVISSLMEECSLVRWSKNPALYLATKQAFDVRNSILTVKHGDGTMLCGLLTGKETGAYRNRRKENHLETESSSGQWL